MVTTNRMHSPEAKAVRRERNRRRLATEALRYELKQTQYQLERREAELRVMEAALRACQGRVRDLLGAAHTATQTEALIALWTEHPDLEMTREALIMFFLPLDADVFMLGLRNTPWISTRLSGGERIYYRDPEHAWPPS